MLSGCDDAFEMKEDQSIFFFNAIQSECEAKMTGSFGNANKEFIACMENKLDYSQCIPSSYID